MDTGMIGTGNIDPGAKPSYWMTNQNQLYNPFIFTFTCF